LKRLNCRKVSPKQRKDLAYADKIKRKVDELDAWCRLEPLNARELALVGPCKGGMTWAHLPDWRRSKTRNEEPEKRHTLQGSFKCCVGHHAALDQKKFGIAHGEDGADGLMVAVPYVAKGAA
jgi:hypothetical protein